MSSDTIAQAVLVLTLVFGATAFLLGVFARATSFMAPSKWFLLSMSLIVVGAASMLGLLNRRHVPTPCEAVAVAATSACEAQNAVLMAQLRSEQERLKDVESIVWEVHTLPATPSGNVEALCNSIGDHSVLRTDNEVHGYSVWTNGRGEVKLGCRYLRPKEAP